MIVRSKRRNTYTKIDNEIFKNVDDLVAVGLLAYLLSLPDDWIVYKITLYPKFKQGRGAVDKAFKILKELGYLVGKRKQDEKGLMNGFEWIVYETPFDRGFIHKAEIGSTEIESIQPKTIAMDNHIMDNEQLLTTNNKQTTNKLQTTKVGLNEKIEELFEGVDMAKINLFHKWRDYRKLIKKPIKDASIESVIKRFKKEPTEKLLYVIEASIENGWQGLFWDKYNLKNNNNGKSIIETAEQRSWNN